METLKRKYAEDLHGQQAKKLRMAHFGSGFGAITEGHSVEEAENTPALSPPACSTAEMAIVLYKPTIPELLRDQPVPRAPMVQLDMRLLHTGMLGHKSGSAADVFKHFARRNVLMLRETPEELDRTSLEVTSGESSGNSLAVIPWANHSASIPSTSLSSLEKIAFLPVASQTASSITDHERR